MKRLLTPDGPPLHLVDQILDGSRFVLRVSSSRANPPRTAGELLDTLRALGLVRSVAKLRELL
jgi:hypothetical protein